MRGERVELTPTSAWVEGTNLKQAAREHPKEVRGWLFLEVAKLIKDIDAKKTLATDEEMTFTCRAILDEHPTLKMEEVRVIFDYIRMGKFGKLYERLKTAEILECIRQYEGTHRADVIEAEHERKKKSVSSAPARNLEPLGLAKMLDEAVKDLPDEDKPKRGLGTWVREANGWDK